MVFWESYVDGVLGVQCRWCFGSPYVDGVLGVALFVNMIVFSDLECSVF